MKILALETSGNHCSAALLTGDRLEQRCEHAPRQHADLILGMLDALLEEAGLRLTELDAIACGRGPGSFTGVRIAAAVAQGVAFGAGRPVIGISTLAATARAAFRHSGQRKIACALDARMDEVYWGCYYLEGDGEAKLLDQELVVAPEQTPALPPGISGTSWCAAGSGWVGYPGLRDRHQSELLICQEPISAIIPEASDVAWLARAAFDQAQRPDRAAPVYLRNRVAEVSRKSAASI
ncbi:tRNA (adenosine(37)-N6)-threonylcarbamoyltransferase complex dimerization subunit type 1 TsaB [Halochromatium sp.]